MADNKITIELDLEEQKALRALTALTKKVDDFGDEASNSFKKANSAFSVFTGAVGAIGVVKAIDIIGNSLGAVTDQALEFSAAVAEINSILPKNEQLTLQSKNAFIEFSSAFGGTPARQAKAFYSIVSAGVQETSNQLRVLEAANKAAVAGLVEIDTAAFALVSSVNSYAESSLTAGEASDILFTAVREGQTTFGELASSIGRVAPLAASAGVSFSELGGTLAFITKSGISTAEAVTGLRAILTAIQKPSSEAAEAAERLGLDFSAAALKAKGFEGFIKDLRVAVSGNRDDLTKLFGSVEALTPILQLTGGSFQEFQRILAQTSTAAGATESAFQVIEKSAAFQFQQLQQELANIPQAFLINFEEPTAEALKQIREFVGTDGLLLMGETFLAVIDIIQLFRKAMEELIPSDAEKSLEENTEKTLKLLDTLEALQEIRNKTARDIGEDDVRIQNLDKKIAKTKELLDAESNRRKELIETTKAEDQAFIEQTARLENIREKIQEGQRKQEADNKGFQEQQLESDRQFFQKQGEQKTQAQRDEAQKLAEFKAEQKALEEEERELELQLREDRASEDLEFLAERLGQEEAVREQARINRLKANGKLVEAEKKQIATRNKAEKQGIFERQKFSELSDKQKLNNLQRTSDTIATLQNSSSSKLAKTGKAFALFSATVRGAQAVNLALSSAPPPFNFVLAALVGAATLEQINKIKNARPPSGGNFQDGGIIPGTSFSGDQVQARVNSGELILNRRQQENLFQAINQNELGGSNITVNVDGDRVTDQNMIDSIVEGINDAIEFRNVDLRTA